MTRYQRVEGNWISFTCACGPFMVLLMLLFAFDLYIMSIVGQVGFFVVIIMVIGIFFIPWMMVSPTIWKNRWFLRISQEGITDNAFGYKRFYPWTSIVSYEIEQPPAYVKGRHRHQLILRLERKTVRLPIFKYGIDTESEISRFVSELETLLLDN